MLDEKVADSKDEKTGLPIYSLYGKRRKPTAETLEGVDALVYDIQDIGCRFYTYISTLGLVLEAAKEHKLQRRRPRPAEPDRRRGRRGAGARRRPRSFIAYHALPVRHGMTVGELATLFNAERELEADLDVVAVTGWRRGDLFDRTGPDVGQPVAEHAEPDRGPALPRHRPAGDDQRQRRPRHGTAVRVGRRAVDRRPTLGRRS